MTQSKSTMADTRSKEEILDLIKTEMKGNLSILIDPKKKDSFNEQRVNTWVKTTSERLYYYLIEQEKMTQLEQKQDELINLLRGQVVDLSMMSKIELGDDVIQKWTQLKEEIEEIKDIDSLKTNLYNSLKKPEENYVPFVSEVEEFNAVMGKPNNYNPVIPAEKEWMFVYNFILEELEEYKHACETGNIVEVLDALCDITYVSLGNGGCLHGLKDKIWPAYQEVQASNLSKACSSEKEAQETVRVRSQEQKTACHYEKIGEYYIVYRSSDKKVMKNINYFRPNLSKFFTEEEIKNSTKSL